MDGLGAEAGKIRQNGFGERELFDLLCVSDY
jgi:hypothetical protein